MPSLLLAHAIKSLSFGGSGSGWGYTPKLWGPGYQGNWGAYAPGEWDPEKAAGALRLNSVVAACTAWIQRNYPKPRLVVEERDGDEWKEVPGHRLPLLVERPNRHYAKSQLWQRTLADWVPTGNAYWVKERNQAGEIIGLYHRPECHFRPDFPKERSKVFISRYLETVDGKEQEWPVEDVIHFRFGFDPQNERLGWSPLRAGLNEIGTLNNGAAYRGSLLDKQGVPAYALTVTDEQSRQELLKKDQGFFDGVREKFRALFSRGRAGGLFFPSFPAELTRVGFSPAELDIITMLAWDSDIVCALIGLSAMVVNLPSGNGQRTFANQADAREAAFEQCIMPYQLANAEDLTLQLLPDFEEDTANFRVAWNYTKVPELQGDVNRDRTILLLAQKQSVLAPSEVRSMGWDLKPLDAKQQAEIEAAKPQPPALGPPDAESNGDRRASSQGQPFSRDGKTGVNGNGQNGAKALAEPAYRVAEVDPGAVAAEEFEGIEEFWEERSARWAGEVEGEEEDG